MAKHRKDTTMTHTTAQKVRMRLTAVIAQLSEKARSDERLKGLGGQSLTVMYSRAAIRSEYRGIVRDEFPGCVVTFIRGRVQVFPPEGYMAERGSVGVPVGGRIAAVFMLGM